ncbi:MAG: hypothetical protein KAJ28_01005 [Flavobacteriaceae bacterium]|nr:hypothetical protein [Flavobacteriaceae bacterium]
MNKKNKLFISCDEASHNCDKSQYNEASFLEKIKLSIHLLYCQACRKYSKNNSKLSTVIEGSNVDCLEIKDKQKMKDCFEKELKQQQQ